jgi:DNA-binding NarL/FixJ family response regulator
VLLVDDHPLVSEPLANYLAAQPDIDVVGSLTSVAELATAEIAADVVLLDYELPDGNGVDAIAALRKRMPQTRVIMLTAHTDDPVVLDALRAGADGFLAKTRARSSDVADAVRRAMAGEVVMPTGSGARLAELIEMERHRLIGDFAQRALSPREREVIEALFEGLAAKEIAQRLGISLSTTRTHLESVRTKLGAHSMLEAVAIALRERLIEPPPHRRTLIDG